MNQDRLLLPIGARAVDRILKAMRPYVPHIQLASGCYVSTALTPGSRQAQDARGVLVQGSPPSVRHDISNRMRYNSNNAADNSAKSRRPFQVQLAATWGTPLARPP
jgi:hypothetical protein